jgi:hypothetical protein
MKRGAYSRDLVMPLRKNFLSEAMPTITPFPKAWRQVGVWKSGEKVSAQALSDMM